MLKRNVRIAGVIILVLIVAVAVYFASRGTSSITGGKESVTGETKIYVNIVSHNEDTQSKQYPDFTKDKNALLEQRDAVADFATMLVKNKVKYNFETDWNFLLGLAAFDKGSAHTNNKPLLSYLAGLGVAIDPHSHEHNGYNYADAAYLISQQGVTPSTVVGGFIADPVNASTLEYFWRLTKGKKYPSYTWKPTVLWGAGTSLHKNENDLLISGVWRPKDAEHFAVDDPKAKLPVVGTYKYDWTGLDDLLAKLDAGTLEKNALYTVTIMTYQEKIDAAFIADFEKHLKTYADETQAGKIVWATITQTVDDWKTLYGSRPTMLKWGK